MATRRRRVKSAEPDHESKELTREDVSDPSIDIREGDRIVISTGEVKVSFGGTYSSVTIPSVMFTRTLKVGDDLEEQFEKIYAFIEGKQQHHTKRKLAWFAEHVKKAQGNA